MPEEAPNVSIRALEPEVRKLWEQRRLPSRNGRLGPPDGPVVRQFEGLFVPGDPPELVAHRAVVADVDARHRMLTGRGVIGTLRGERAAGDAAPDRIGPILESLGVWTGGTGERPWDSAERQAGVQAIVSRLARREILAARDGPLRVCLSCRVPRSPERIIYQKEVGDTFLVRFPLQGTEPSVDALVWVDAPWRLLGASALLVHPDIPYAVVEYRHKGASAMLLTSHGSLDRLRAWMPDVELVVHEERPGREWVGRAYAYPLRHEFPIGGSLDPPAGTVQADGEVGDTGTGIVPLVPGHGPTDAEIAERRGITGWPLLTSRGLLDPTLMHKYSGLDVETANEFVARDLTESGAVLARLRVVRGVPYCALCGHRMVWIPGRAWCLEPGRLPTDQKERYARLLPHDRPIGQIEVARWPVSETGASTDPSAIALLECARCERLDAPDGPTACPCGGTRRRIARRLLPSLAGAFAAWARNEPVAPADSVRLYANERRRAPVLVHQLVAMTGAEASTSEVGLTLVPTVNRVDLASLVASHGADAVRTAFVRTSGPGGAAPTFEERCTQEEARLDHLLARTQAVLAQCGPEILREGSGTPDASARDLEVEDRAILARWAHAHLRILTAYDRWTPEVAHRQLFRFVERDLRRYLELTRPRLEFAGTPATKRAALRILVYLLRRVAVALAPIAPFTCEAIHRRLQVEARSLFETTDLGADRSLADEGMAGAWDRWWTVIDAADHIRRAHHLPPATALPVAVIVLPDEEAASKLRPDRATMERLARIAKLEISSPQVPWAARQRRLVPVESEIQRVYPSLATQIVHLLERMPPRRSSETARELTVFVHGVPRTIPPEMVTAVDTLPEGYAPTPFAAGEMYVQLPGRSDATRPPPPLSPDGFWVVRRIARQLRRAPPATDPEGHVALVAAVDPLANELREKASAIAAYLGLRELRVLGTAPEALPHARIQGRTRTGAPWSISLPGVALRRRAPKHRAARSDGRRVPPPRVVAGPVEVDFADEKVIAREQSIRDLGHQLDELFAAPLLGPAKVTIAWDAGLRSMENFHDTPFDTLAALPGFGRPIAAKLWTKIGRSVPAGTPRARRSPSAASLSRRTSPASASSGRPAATGPAGPVAMPEATASTGEREIVDVPGAEIVPVSSDLATTSALPTEPVREADGVAPSASLAPITSEPGRSELVPFSPESVIEGTNSPALSEPEPPAPSEGPEPVDGDTSPREIGEGTEAASEIIPPVPMAEIALPPPIGTPESELPLDEPFTPPADQEPPIVALSIASETGEDDIEGREGTVPGETPEPATSPGSDPAGSGPIDLPEPPAEIDRVPDDVSAEPGPARSLPPEVGAVEVTSVVNPDEGAVEPALDEVRGPPLADPAAANPSEAGGDLEGEPSMAEEPTVLPVEPSDLSSVKVEAQPGVPGEAPISSLSEGEVEEARPVEPERAEADDIEIFGPTVASESGAPLARPPEEAEIPPDRSVDLAPIAGAGDAPLPSTAPPEEPAAPPEIPQTGPSSPEATGPDADLPPSEAEPTAGPPETTFGQEEPPFPTEGSQSGPAVPPEPSADEADRLAPETSGRAPAIPETVGDSVPAGVPAEEPVVSPEVALVRETSGPIDDLIQGPSSSEPAPASVPIPAVPPISPSVPEVEVEAPTIPSFPADSPAPPTALPAQISPPEPVPPPAAPAPVEIPPPPPAGLEVDVSSGLFHALQPFLDATAAGHRGIALVRELPERIRVHIGPRPVEVYWLTNLQRPRTLRPTDLAALTQRLRSALDDEGVSAIFFEGIEYLVGIHGIESVLGFLRDLDAAARQRSARVWVHLTPSLISEANLDRVIALGTNRPAPE